MTQAMIYGRRRQGKSTLSLMLALACASVIAIYDPNNQYQSVPSAGTLEELYEQLQRNRVVRFVPLGDPKKSFRGFAEIVWAYRHCGIAIIVDECSLLQGAATMESSLDKMVRQLPDGNCLIQNTHRVTDSSVLTRHIATDWFFFFTQHRIDLERIEADFEDSGPEIRRAIQSLRDHELVHVWIAEGGRILWSKWSPESYYVEIQEANVAA